MSTTEPTTNLIAPHSIIRSPQTPTGQCGRFPSLPRGYFEGVMYYLLPLSSPAKKERRTAIMESIQMSKKLFLNVAPFCVIVYKFLACLLSRSWRVASSPLGAMTRTSSISTTT